MLSLSENIESMGDQRDYHKQKNRFMKTLLTNQQYQEFYGRQKPRSRKVVQVEKEKMKKVDTGKVEALIEQKKVDDKTVEDKIILTHRVVDIKLNLDELIDGNGNVNLPQSPSKESLEQEVQTNLVAKELVAKQAEEK